MKKLFSLLLVALCAMNMMAQVPYFAGTVGDGKLDGYTSLKFRPGINAQQTYTTFQYGIGDHVAAGLDITTGGGNAYEGYTLRFGHKISPAFNIGAQFTPTFDLGKDMHFSYMTNALYMNGAFCDNLFWCSNTFYTLNDGDAENSFDQWMYLGHNTTAFGNSLTLMAGALYSDSAAETYTDLGAGCYYTVDDYTFYLWGNDFLTKDNPRLVVGIEFVF